MRAESMLVQAIGPIDQFLIVANEKGFSPDGGTLLIERLDSSGNINPYTRELVLYTGLIGNMLVGLTRGMNGTNAQAHPVGAIVEAMNFFVGSEKLKIKRTLRDFLDLL